MFDSTPETDQFGTLAKMTIDELRAFVDGHQDALLNAAGLLGGSPGIRLGKTAFEGLAGPGTPSRRTMQVLYQILDLLMLEHVHDFSRIEAELFASIDPASACVEEICLLADQLNERLAVCRRAGVNEGESDQRAVA